MKFVVLTTRAPGADLERHLAAEQRRGQQLRMEGFIEQVFRRPDGKGTVLVVEDASIEAARARLDSLPLAEHGLMTMELIEVEPVSAP